MENETVESRPGAVRRRLATVCNSRYSAEKRVFAALELICAPVSFLTVFVLLPFQIIAPHYGVNVPVWALKTIQVMLSAAIGYITNYIALEMLFKPFDRTWKHWLTFCTFGYWRQGLVPKSKSEIGEKIGEQVEKRLLPPKQLAEQISGLALGLLDKPDAVESVRQFSVSCYREHRTVIIETLGKALKARLNDAIAAIVTADAIRIFLKETAMPAVNTPELRGVLSERILDEAQKYTPTIAELLKEEILKAAKGYAANAAKSIPILAMFKIDLAGLIDKIVGGMDWQAVAESLNGKLQAPESRAFLEEKLSACAEEVANWLEGQGATAMLEGFTAVVREKIISLSNDMFDKNASEVLDGLVESDSLWTTLQTAVLPVVKTRLDGVVREKGTEYIAERLSLGKRAAEAIERQDTRQFYEMITSLAQQHLGAIQVLGYLLGAIIGVLQLLGR